MQQGWRAENKLKKAKYQTKKKISENKRSNNSKDLIKSLNVHETAAAMIDRRKPGMCGRAEKPEPVGLRS